MTGEFPRPFDAAAISSTQAAQSAARVLPAVLPPCIQDTDMPHLSSRILVAACLALGAAVSCGCSHISVFSRDKIGRADQQNPAAEIISLWQPAKGPGPTGVPGRGFAGQILFFTRGSGAPVAVDGDVRVYLFDNQGTAEEQAKPIWQFDFPAQDWQNFGSVGTLGPSYNIFIPYVREGQQQAECAVQIRFTPKAGPVVFSEMTQVTLPGRIDAAEGGFLPEKPSPLAPQLAAPAAFPAAIAAPVEPRRLNPAQRGVSVHTIRPQAAGGIEQVSHTTPAGPITPAGSADRPRPLQPRATGIVHADYSDAPSRSRDQRLEELERYVRELEAERARPPRSPRAVRIEESDAVVNPTPHSSPARRMRLTPAATESAYDAGSLLDDVSSDWDRAEE
jgi:hypothetical protein